jgi:hypothetical protein
VTAIVVEQRSCEVVADGDRSLLPGRPVSWARGLWNLCGAPRGGLPPARAGCDAAEVTIRLLLHHSVMGALLTAVPGGFGDHVSVARVALHNLSGRRAAEENARNRSP